MNPFNSFLYGSNEFIGRLYLIVSSLIAFGLLTLYSISSEPLSLSSSFSRQIIFILFSLLIFFLIGRINIKTIHDNSTLIYIFYFFLFLIPFFLSPVENTYRWIDFGLFYIQPGEYLKCATIILIAKYLSNHQLEVKEGYVVIIPIIIALMSSLLVLNQPDLGTAVIIFAPVLPMLLWAGVNTFNLFLLILTFPAVSNPDNAPSPAHENINPNSLGVPLNTSIERNNNRFKFGKETEEELRQRFALNENARFLADEYNFIDATLPFREVTTQVSQSIWNLRI